MVLREIYTQNPFASRLKIQKWFFKKIHKIILNDHKKKLIEIAGTLKISKERVGHIVHEYGYAKPLCGVVQTQKTEFYRRCVTTDETWIHYSTPESHRQSALWTASDEHNRKRGKTQQSAGMGILGCTRNNIH